MKSIEKTKIFFNGKEDIFIAIKSAMGEKEGGIMTILYEKLFLKTSQKKNRIAGVSKKHPYSETTSMLGLMYLYKAT